MSDGTRGLALRDALIAFLFHGPGLRFFTRFRMSRWLFRTNLIALGVTLGAMAALAIFGPVGVRTKATFAAWLVGHFGWSLFLSAYVYRASSR